MKVTKIIIKSEKLPVLDINMDDYLARRKEK